MPPSSTKDPSHKEHKKKKKKKLIDSKEQMNKHQNKNDQRVKSIYLVENKNNCAKNNLEKLDEENENLDEKMENKTGERNDENSKSFIDNSNNKQNGESDSIIMENKHIENSDIVKSEKEDENEQIQNGGATIILKDDGKTVNKNDYTDKPTTNKKEKSKSKSAKTKKKKRQKKKSINNEIHATCDEKEVKPNNTGHYDKITPVYDNITPVSID
jgi:TfoX/Sxy family transcriptional regulator of competence genes